MIAKQLLKTSRSGLMGGRSAKQQQPIMMASDSLNKCWEDNYKNQPGYHVTHLTTKSLKLKEEGNIRIVCVSDTHSLVENVQPPFNIPEGDILIHAGDFTNQGNLDKVKEFNSWLGSLPHKHKIVTNLPNCPNLVVSRPPRKTSPY